MSQNWGQGILPSAGLTTEQAAAVEQLTVACNEYEGANLRVFPELAQDERDGVVAGKTDATVHQFLAYHDGTLIGFAHMDGMEAVEVSGMVHPAHRRQGVGRSLFETVKVACRERGLADLLLVCDESAPSGRVFAEAVGARFRFAEYSLELDQAAASRMAPPEGPVKLRPADVRDRDTLVRLSAAAFGDPEDEVRQRVDRGLHEPIQRYFIGMLGDEPIGSIRLSRHDPNVYITAFGVLPSHRGRGHGRQMLREAIAMLLAENTTQIRIEVETENRNALSLYQSCGFKDVSQYSYYHVDL